MGYINVIITACVFFPIIAFLITLPYIIYNYIKMVLINNIEPNLL